MLDLRPNCELCDADLPPDAADARICTYECTYCAACAEDVLHHVCPTCGGNLVPRPIRPARALRPELKLGLANHPASTQRRHSKWSRDQIDSFVNDIRHIPPDQR
ncbi:MAG: DUF1272 domain-containing protein [Alphaproteobacteria bacterium]|uniref:DUF1272 domain-containing protein n=1 Tax=Pacificispira sp. TaxID=2888761 RepID=UPI001B030B5A|nr:DUF1272 domain-containing protein [Alphaproteobacteria bacterium]MBO6864349.1 DUF1272 domain-containing protein [Alphaproteobacteria bacterium]MEC9265741.1 DUF1272 domain-containing protein [Pseudomonadota bacterium]